MYNGHVERVTMNNYIPNLTGGTVAEKQRGTTIYERGEQTKILAFESTANEGWAFNITIYTVTLVPDPNAKGQRHIELKLPERKPKGTKFQWLDYRHQYQQIFGEKITYKEIARLSGYEVGTFKQYARKWKLENGNK